MQNLPWFFGMAGERPGVIELYVGDARVGWIDDADIAGVAAAALRDPNAHAGRTYPLATDLALMDEIAGLLSKVTAAEAGRHRASLAGIDPWKTTCQVIDARTNRTLGSLC